MKIKLLIILFIVANIFLYSEEFECKLSLIGVIPYIEDGRLNVIALDNLRILKDCTVEFETIINSKPIYDYGILYKMRGNNVDSVFDKQVRTNKLFDKAMRYFQRNLFLDHFTISEPGVEKAIKTDNFSVTIYRLDSGPWQGSKGVIKANTKNGNMYELNYSGAIVFICEFNRRLLVGVTSYGNQADFSIYMASY